MKGLVALDIWLTRKDLQKLEITDVTRDDLVVNFNHVKIKKEGNRYCYYFSDLLKSVIFRLSLIKNYKKLSKLDFDDNKFELTDEIKQELKGHKYEDRFWLEEIHLRSFQDRFVERCNEKLSDALNAVSMIYDRCNKSAEKLDDFKFYHGDLLRDIKEIAKESDDFVITFNSKFNVSAFDKLALSNYNRNLKYMLNDLLSLLSPKVIGNSISAKIENLSSFININSAFNNYAGDLSQDERRIVKHLRGLLNKDRQFEKVYREIVNSEFSLKNVGLYYSFNDLDSDVFQQEPVLGDEYSTINSSSSNSVSWENTVTEKEKELVLIGSSQNREDEDDDSLDNSDDVPSLPLFENDANDVTDVTDQLDSDIDISKNIDAAVIQNSLDFLDDSGDDKKND